MTTILNKSKGVVKGLATVGAVGAKGIVGGLNVGVKTVGVGMKVVGSPAGSRVSTNLGRKPTKKKTLLARIEESGDAFEFGIVVQMACPVRGLLKLNPDSLTNGMDPVQGNEILEWISVFRGLPKVDIASEAQALLDAGFLEQLMTDKSEEGEDGVEGETSQEEDENNNLVTMFNPEGFYIFSNDVKDYAVFEALERLKKRKAEAEATVRKLPEFQSLPYRDLQLVLEMFFENKALHFVLAVPLIIILGNLFGIWTVWFTCLVSFFLYSIHRMKDMRAKFFDNVLEVFSGRFDKSTKPEKSKWLNDAVRKVWVSGSLQKIFDKYKPDINQKILDKLPKDAMCKHLEVVKVIVGNIPPTLDFHSVEGLSDKHIRIIAGIKFLGKDTKIVMRAILGVAGSNYPVNVDITDIVLTAKIRIQITLHGVSQTLSFSLLEEPYLTMSIQPFDLSVNTMNLPVLSTMINKKLLLAINKAVVWPCDVKFVLGDTTAEEPELADDRGDDSTLPIVEVAFISKKKNVPPDYFVIRKTISDSAAVFDNYYLCYRRSMTESPIVDLYVSSEPSLDQKAKIIAAKDKKDKKEKKSSKRSKEDLLPPIYFKKGTLQGPSSVLNFHMLSKSDNAPSGYQVLLNNDNQRPALFDGLRLIYLGGVPRTASSALQSIPNDSWYRAGKEPIVEAMVYVGGGKHSKIVKKLPEGFEIIEKTLGGSLADLHFKVNKKPAFLAIKRGRGTPMSSIAVTTVDRSKEMTAAGYELIKCSSKKYSDRTCQNAWLWIKREAGCAITDIALAFLDPDFSSNSTEDTIPADYITLDKTYSSSAGKANGYLNQPAALSMDPPPRRIVLCYKTDGSKPRGSLIRPPSLTRSNNKVEQEIEKELVKMASMTNLVLASRAMIEKNDQLLPVPADPPKEVEKGQRSPTPVRLAVEQPKTEQGLTSGERSPTNSRLVRHDKQPISKVGETSGGNFTL
eukprot:TRINITY_DN2414_c0_g1_i1.p1 TRINITY_DN2414_c0_g1~~TRINITY_DN2414_c0_g1_i1.p1  ORF type:complete len:963 (+),score=212.52 TRINITY_DN2414_c0_g1_i1:250-3138(+)